MIIAGVDPGLSGAIALLDAESRAVTLLLDMPTFALTRGGKNKRELDLHALSSIFNAPIGHVFVEKVGAMPGQGVSSVFAFGKAYGATIGIIAARGIPMSFVSPVRWKKALGVPASKDGARARASQLLPSGAHHWPLVKHDGRAEAALIAYYGIAEFTTSDRVGTRIANTAHGTPSAGVTALSPLYPQRRFDLSE